MYRVYKLVYIYIDLRGKATLERFHVIHKNFLLGTILFDFDLPLLFFKVIKAVKHEKQTHQYASLTWARTQSPFSFTIGAQKPVFTSAATQKPDCATISLVRNRSILI